MKVPRRAGGLARLSYFKNIRRIKMAEITAKLAAELREKSGAGVARTLKPWLRLKVIRKSNRVLREKGQWLRQLRKLTVLPLKV